MSETTSHPVKTGIETELHYKRDLPVTIHRAGCRHPAEEKSAFDAAEIQADDYFAVAPCARA